MKVIEAFRNFKLENRSSVFKTFYLTIMICAFEIFSFLRVILLEAFEYDIYISIGLSGLMTFIFVAIYHCMKKHVVAEDCFEKRKMNVGIFLSIMSFNLIVVIISNILITIVQLINGVENTVIIGTPDDTGWGLDSIIRATIFGPIIEEIMFRGAGLLLFKKSDNKLEAIIFTSVIFGLMHGNFSQAISATIAGIIYGYVAVQFGLTYSIIFHIMSNVNAYLCYFLGISEMVSNISLLFLIWWLWNQEIIIKELRENLVCQNKFSFRRFISYFLNPIILLFTVFWIIQIIIMF